MGVEYGLFLSAWKRCLKNGTHIISDVSRTSSSLPVSSSTFNISLIYIRVRGRSGQRGGVVQEVGVFVCLLIGCLTSQQQASVSPGRICSDNCTCCHTEVEAADQTFYLTQSQYTDTRLTSPSTDPLTPGRVAAGVPMCQC